MPTTPDSIASLAKLFRRRAAGDAVETQNPEEASYAEVLGALNADERVDVVGMLRGTEFRPFFVMNGLLLANGFTEDGIRFTLDALATGLETFAEYLAFIADRGAMIVGPESWAALEKEQKRFFAFLITQMPECGMDLGGVLTSMKGDALDQESAMEVRQVLDDGPEALVTSDLFTREEQALWKDVLEQKPDAPERLRDHLVKAYGLPFRAAPAVANA